MKKNKTTLLIMVVIAMFIYGCFCYVLLEPNPLLYCKEDRFLFIWMIMGGWATFVIPYRIIE